MTQITDDTDDIDDIKKSLAYLDDKKGYDVYALTPNEYTSYTPSVILGTVVTPASPSTINKPISTTDDAVQEDINTMLLQQNTLYTMGVLTATTFLITAILLAK
jgi:hypothetical protein